MQCNKSIALTMFKESETMNTKVHSKQNGSQLSVDTLSLQRESIIKKAQESVRASHQRMRNRVRHHARV